MNSVLSKDNVDAYGEVSEALKSLEKKKITMRDAISDSVLLANIPSDQKVIEDGNDYTLSISIEGTDHIITDMHTIFKFLGKKKFCELAKIGIKDLRENLTPEQFNKVTGSIPGKRKVTCRRKSVATKTLEELNEF